MIWHKLNKNTINTLKYTISTQCCEQDSYADEETEVSKRLRNFVFQHSNMVSPNIRAM